MATIIRATNADQSARLRSLPLDELDDVCASQHDGGTLACDLSDSLDQQAAALLKPLTKAIEQIVTSRAEWLAHWERQVVHLAVAIAGRIARREARQAPEVTLELVRETLEMAAGSPEIQLRLHPEDCADLGPQLERMVTEIARIGKVVIIPDSGIERSGCVATTRFGMIDQQFTTQLDRIEQELLD